jgi:hypothetical protein
MTEQRCRGYLKVDWTNGGFKVARLVERAEGTLTWQGGLTITCLRRVLGISGIGGVLAFINRPMSTIQIVDPANTVLTNLCGPATRITYAALSDLSSFPVSTLWDRAHGRQSRSEKAAKQQYLTPQEEKALVSLCLMYVSERIPFTS